jgi:hypothetical protein
VDLANGFRRDGAPFEAALINPLVNSYLRFRFELQIALVAVFAIVVVQRALDVNRMRVVPFDRISHARFRPSTFFFLVVAARAWECWPTCAAIFIHLVFVAR